MYSQTTAVFHMFSCHLPMWHHCTDQKPVQRFPHPNPKFRLCTLLHASHFYHAGGWIEYSARPWLDVVAGCSALRAIPIITQQFNHRGFLQLLICADNQAVFWSALDPQGRTGAVMQLIATNASEVCSETTFPCGLSICRSLYRWEEKRTCPAFGSVLSEILWRVSMPDILTTLLT